MSVTFFGPLLVLLLVVHYSKVSYAVDASENCTFDEISFCGWTNEVGDHFNWTLNKEATRSGGTGPSSDHSGTGHYVYIEASYKTYDMIARLLSPVVRGPKSMRFYYHMYGEDIDTLNVYKRKNEGEERLWSRFGSHGDKWIEGCVLIPDNGTFQLVIEGVRGLDYRGDIAVDDIYFTDNLHSCNQNGTASPDKINSANCSFDTSLCGWRNQPWAKNNFILNSNVTSSNYTGPSEDHTGGGHYIYMYGESGLVTAQLESSRLIGPQCMRFYYHMYSEDSLIDVYLLKMDSTEVLTWNVSGNHGDMWNEALVTFNFKGEFKVMLIAEANRSVIAIDDVTFTYCLMSEPREANCDFEEGNACTWTIDGSNEDEFKWTVSTDRCGFEQADFCGWQNIKSDDIDWKYYNGPTMSNGTGPSQAYEGHYFAYIEASSRPPGSKAKLLSPRMVGPRCMTFYYHMYGEHMGSIAIYLRLDGEKDSKLWEMNGDQGNKWRNVILQINYEHASVKVLRQFQLLIVGTLGSFFKSDAAIDNIFFTDGLCDAESRRSSGADIGAYILTRASRPLDFGKTTHLTSPYFTKPTCMAFYYRMLGTSESCIVVASVGMNSSKILWLRSGKTEQWIPAQVNIQETGVYNVIIKGITSTGTYDEAAISRITFDNKPCQLRSENATFHVATFKGSWYEIDKKPLNHSSYLEEFTFTAPHPWGDADENAYFVYPTVEAGQEFFSRELLLRNRKVFPLDYIVSTTTNKSEELIYLISRGNRQRQAISTNNNTGSDCCKDKRVSTFRVSSVEQTALSKNPGCSPGWYRDKDFCYLLNLKRSLSWNQARIYCHKQAAELAVILHKDVLETLSKITTGLGRENAMLYLGLKGKVSQWTWLNGSIVSNPLWAPHAPSEHGRCGALLNTNEHSHSHSVRRTWYWKDQRCDKKNGYICEQQPASLGCKSLFFRVGATCFHVNTTENVTWAKASERCQGIGGELAAIDRDSLTNDTLIQKLPVGGRSLHIGLLLYEHWQWLDGTTLNTSFWHPGYPQNITKWPTCAALSVKEARLLNFHCKARLNFVCRTKNMNVAYGQLTDQSSASEEQNSFLAIDDSYTTCFRSMQEPYPWWKVGLQRTMYIYLIKIMHTTACCPKRTLKIEILKNGTVSTNPCQASIKHGDIAEVDLRCEPPILGDRVLISIASDDASLFLCNVAVYAIDTHIQDVHGVLHESWYDVSYNPMLATTMKDNPEFIKAPESRNIIDKFETAIDFEERSIHRWSAYIQVEESSKYKLIHRCGDLCELWIKDLREEGFNEDEQEEISGANQITSSTDSTGNFSKAYYLSRCQLYLLESYVVEEIRSDDLSVKIRGPGDVEEKSIDTELLYWITPGKRTLEFTLDDETWRSAVVGLRVSITGVYRYCCHGMYCPDCPIHLQFIVNTTKETLLFSQEVSMSCVNSSFSSAFTTNEQPGNYTMKIRYSFENEPGQIQHTRDIGNVELKAELLYECQFTTPSKTCTWQSEGQPWKFNYPGEEGSFAYVENAEQATLVSPILPWKQFHKVVGVCLRFVYLMKQPSSNLNVFLRFHDKTQTPLWELTGYHGEQLISRAQVYWPGERDIQIVFEGSGTAATDEISVAIDDIAITTENCPLMPYYAKPGFQCSKKEFRCHNGQCIKRSYKCDGDRNCKDNSDESDCKCPSDRLSCLSGECIPTNSLCNGRKDCADGSDERNCGDECAGKPQCLDGTCAPWSEICKEEGSCLDEIQCGTGHCLLESAPCDNQQSNTSNITKTRCRSFRGVCGFETSLCGLKHDRQATFSWTLGSAATPTDNTGPSYDHTTFTTEGAYVFIEASQRRHGDTARLLSGDMEPNETICLQFWYHMYGKDIGTLRVLVLTNQSRTVVWEQKGARENRWRFAQTSFLSSIPYQFAFEGETATGKEGDIALDDLSLSDGVCQHIKDQVSDDCHFDQDMCGWDVQENWKFGREALRHSLTLSGTSQLRNITSPAIDNRWTCLKFLYFTSHHGDHSTLAVIEPQADESEDKTLFEVKKETATGWHYVQISIPASTNKSRQIRFSGYNQNVDGPILAVDNVSFTKEPCKQIPWKDTTVVQRCNTTDSMCRWTILKGEDQWRRGNYSEVQEINDDIKKATSSHTKQGNPDNHYELQLPDRNSGNLTFQHFEALAQKLTICFWVRTKFGAFFLEYKDLKETLVFGLHTDKFLQITIRDDIKNTDFVINDGTWHHVCQILSAQTDSDSVTQVKIYNNGNSSDMQIHNSYMTAVGVMVIGFTSTNASSNTRMVGSISGFNVWNYALRREEVLRMSSGCGEEAGNVKAWSSVNDAIVGVVNTVIASCKDRKADRLLLSSETNATAFLLSPQYNRSGHWYSHCLKFRYMLYGPGARELTFYQILDGDEKRPVWTVNEKTLKSSWTNGQMPLSGVSGYKVMIAGQVVGRLGYVAVSGVYVDDNDDSCPYQPLNAKRACSYNFTSASGVIVSPFFPSYYLDNMECMWNITVPEGTPVRLNFLEFRLEDHPTCDSDFVEIFDGPNKGSPRLGKFCGYTYPPLVQSSTNHMVLLFKSNGRFTTTGFKARYQSFQERIQDRHCSNIHECPHSCICRVIYRRGIEALVVQGKSVTTLPRGLSDSTVGMLFADNHISRLRDGDVFDLPSLEYLDLSRNLIVYVERDSFSNVSSLKTIRLTSNFIRELPRGVFKKLNNLRALDLGKNLLSNLERGMLDGLLRLNVLSVRGNFIKTLDDGVFENTSNLTHLYLQNNKISSLPDRVFGSLQQLTVLDLSNNHISNLNRETFRFLKSLRYLNLEGNRITKISLDAFSELTHLEYLKVDHFTLCCYAKASIPSLTCDSPKDEFSSCDDLMKNRALRICIWVLGLIAFIGNIAVIIWRTKDKQQNRLQSLLIINLAFADLFMGTYLLIVAVMDARWAGEYFKHDIAWRSGIGCKLAGILSMLSSEVSVMQLTIITAVRYVRVLYMFKVKRLDRKQVTVLCIIAWVIGILISVIPTLNISYFIDKEKGFGFYSRSAVCLPLHLSNEKPIGWEYSVSFFIGLNFLAFMFIIVAYSRIYWHMKLASKAANSKSQRRERALARRLLFIIVSDFCCWMPIIIIGILSLMGRFPDPDKQAYVWIAVFVLPFNSAINPILYTFSATTVKDTISGKSQRSKSCTSADAQEMRMATIKKTRRLRYVDESTAITAMGSMDTRL